MKPIGGPHLQSYVQNENVTLCKVYLPPPACIATTWQQQCLWELLSHFKDVLSTMGVSKESISKFLIRNRFHVKLRILSPYSNRICWVIVLFRLNPEVVIDLELTLARYGFFSDLDLEPQSKIYEKPNPDLESLVIFGSSRSLNGLYTCYILSKNIAEFWLHRWYTKSEQEPDSHNWKIFGAEWVGVWKYDIDTAHLWLIPNQNTNSSWTLTLP